MRISIRLPSGERVIRRFAPDADIEELYAFVECHDVLQDATMHGIEKPAGFIHEYGFQLVSPMPRMVYEVTAGGTIGEKIGRGGNLLVETKDDDDNNDDSNHHGDNAGT